MKPNGKLRKCIDPRDLNKGIEREHYPMKTIEEVPSQVPSFVLLMHHLAVFSLLDCLSG